VANVVRNTTETSHSPHVVAVNSNKDREPDLRGSKPRRHRE